MFAIQLANICKRYLLEYRDRLSLKKSFLNLFKGNKRQKEFCALKEIILDIPKGQTLGIIGKNGSGKTTLLKLICGITKPTIGSLKVNGRVTGLLELGAGFQGDLTGRENIYLNGLILGLSKKEIQKNINSIIDFADIGEFIDVPVRTYSAGMHLRLGFAIAAQLDPDILLIDEVLAVGDATFQKKCLTKLEDFKEDGKTILFVSHNLNLIRQLCQRVILIDKGTIVCDGDFEEVINKYFALIDKKEIGWLTKEIEIRGVYFKNDKDEIVNTFKTGEEMRIIIEYCAHKKIEKPVFGIGIHTGSSYLIGPNTRDDNYPIDFVEGKSILEYKIKSVPFADGEYEVSVSAHNVEETRHYDCHFRLFKFHVLPNEKKIKYGLIGIEGDWNFIE